VLGQRVSGFAQLADNSCQPKPVKFVAVRRRFVKMPDRITERGVRGGYLSVPLSKLLL